MGRSNRKLVVKRASTKAKTHLNRIIIKLRGEGVGAILARGAGVSLIVKMVGTGVAFSVQVLLARVMGAEQYGVYIYVLTWLNILASVATMGWDTALLRYVAAYNAKSEWGAFRGILQTSNQFVLWVSVSVSSLTGLVIWALQNQLQPELTYTFWIGSAILPILTLTSLRQAALRSLRHVALAQLPDEILRPILLTVLVCIVSGIFAQSIDGSTAMVLNAIAATIAFGIGACCLNCLLPQRVKLSSPDCRNREWLRVALPLFLISGMYLILNQTDTIMIGAMLGTTQAGIYATVCRMANLTLFGITAVNAIAAPMISQLYASGQHSQLQHMVTLAARGIFLISVPIALVLIFGGNMLLMLFGSSFVEGLPALVILTVGQMVNALSGSVGFLMTMTGHQREAALIIGSSAILNVVLNAALIPYLGINGAALSTALTTALWNIIMLVYVNKQLKINSTIFF
ncbi:flippase [Coleofasciculus sp. FACHB-712]|uniref:oligosaccharide flippase family protein n=1 Tax=Coleofasciculus sp. FACHB-712 TaxID=2692789 RepID=UPI001687FC36|nr:flippase [Coleofasciculus sp. FACHB-712]